MANTFETGFRSTLAAKLNPADTTATLATVPTVTSGRMLLQSGSTREWISFSGVSGSTITGLVRDLSQTAVPATAGTGLSWVAGTAIVLIAMHDQLIDKQQGTQIQGLTAAERTALSIPSGDSAIVLNTDSGVLEQWIGGSWQTFATGTTPNASATVAGKVEIATSAQTIAGTDTGETGALLSALPSDIAKNAQSGTFVYGADVGGDDTYVVAIAPVLTAYTTGQTFLVKVTTPNTGACTVDFGPGAKSIKDKFGNDPLDGYITGTVALRYDGTNFVVDNPYVVPKWGGTGADGAIGSGALTITGSNNTYIVKNYTSFAPGANTVTVTPTNCVVHLRISGNCDLTGTTFSFSGKGGPGGTAGAGGNGGTGTNGLANSVVYPTGGNCATPAAGVAPLFSTATLADLIAGRQFVGFCGAGGSGGGSGTGGGTPGAGGVGGAGGGCLILEVAGNVTLSGTTATFTGAVGGNGVAGSGGGGDGRGGGGGGGGTFVLLYGGTASGSLTPTVTGGSGGTSGGAGTANNAGAGGASATASGSLGNVGTGAGGAGGAGQFLIAKNTFFS